MKPKTKSILKTLGSAAIISLLLIMPFAILEFLNQDMTRQNAPGLAVLFGLLWVLPTAFIVILAPLVRIVGGDSGVMMSPWSLLLRIGFLTLIATMWGGILIDQLPCFLGYPNCD